MNCKKYIVVLLLISFNLAIGQKYLDSEQVIVSTSWQGNTFSSERTLLENLNAAPNFSKFIKLLIDYEAQVLGEEMVTVFVAIDASFSDLTDEQLEALFSDSNRAKQYFTYLVVPGRLDKNALEVAVLKNNGRAYLSTLHGEKLGVTIVDDVLTLVDANKNKARLIGSDFYFKNGFFHIVEGLVFTSQ